jgi:hypothetical protein
MNREHGHATGSRCCPRDFPGQRFPANLDAENREVPIRLGTKELGGIKGSIGSDTASEEYGVAEMRLTRRR